MLVALVSLLVGGFGVYAYLAAQNPVIIDAPIQETTTDIPQKEGVDAHTPIEVSLIRVEHSVGSDITVLIDFTEPTRLNVQTRGHQIVVGEENESGGKSPIVIPILEKGEIDIFNSRIYLHGNRTRLMLELSPKENLK